MATTSRWPAAVAFTTPATTVVAGACTAPRSAAGRQPCARPHIPGPREKHAACNDDQREHRANDANSLKSREHIRPCRCGSLLIFRQHLVVAGPKPPWCRFQRPLIRHVPHQSGDRLFLSNSRSTVFYFDSKLPYNSNSRRRIAFALSVGHEIEPRTSAGEEAA